MHRPKRQAITVIDRPLIMTPGASIWSKRSLVTIFVTAMTVSTMGGSASNDSGSTSILTAATVEGPRLPITTAGHAGGIVAGVPVVAGGSTWSDDKKTKSWLTDCFVARDGKWIPGPSLPQPLSDPAYASDGSGLYIAGGTADKVQTDQVLFLSSPAPTSKWQTLPSLPAPVEGAAGAILSRKFYVFGGFSGGKAGNELWSLDLDSKDAQWKSAAPLPAIGRAFCAMCALNSQLYLFGGFTSPPYTKEVKVFGDAYRYDPPANQWTRLSMSEFPGYGWTATAVGKNQIMLAGRVPEAAQISDEIDLADLSSNETRSIGKLIGPACCAPLLQIDAQTWWFPGGEPDANSSRSDRTSVITLKSIPRP
jgi:N-acetylneuraminic acid mutarotase